MSNPQIAWHRLREGHANSCARPPLPPIAAVFRCSDARLPNEALFGADCGSLIDVSIWGHTLDTSVLASLEYAVETLGVPLIIVLGHDDCPIMREALRAWEHAELPGGAMRTAVEHALLSIVGRDASAESAQSVTAAHIVQTGLALMQRSPVISRKVDDGTCGIVCATTDCANPTIRVHATMGAIIETTDELIERV